MARGRRKSRDGGMTPFKAGAIALAVIVIAAYFGFTKHVPFTHGFRLKAVFHTANSLRVGSPVRIAGVNVGLVKKVEGVGSSNAAVVTMELQDKALPIHKDASMKIRPRIFLEGNFFVDLQPGTPSSPDVKDDATIPITQTTTPVQLGDVLTALQSDARTQLQELLKGYGTALTHKPTAAENAIQDPQVRGLTGAQALNKNFDYAAPAFKNVAIVNQATLGTQPHDLSKLIASFGKVAGALSRNEVALQDLVTNFNTTMAAFASQATNLSAAIHVLPPTLRVANRTLGHLNSSFPPIRGFAREILPGVHESAATTNASFPWIKQVRGLLGPKELRGLVQEFRPTTAKLAALTDSTLKLLPQLDLINRCVTKIILPTGNVRIQDGPATVPTENYKEFWYTMVGLASEGQNLDGNGMYVRFQPGGGPFTVSTGKSEVTGDQLFGNDVARPLGTRPKYPGFKSVYKPKVPCYTNKRPQLNGPASEIGPGESTVSSTGPDIISPPPGLTGTGTASLLSRATRAADQASKGKGPGSGSVAQQLARRLNPLGGLGSALSRVLANARAKVGERP